MEILILNNFESENSNHGRVCVRMHVVYLFWFFFLSWQLPTRAKAGWWMTDDRSFQCLQRCSWQDALGRRDCSEQFEIRTKTLSSLYVTYHFQLTITNLRASCLPPIDDCTFKCHQRCCWRRILFPPVFPYAGDYFGHPTERWDWIKSMHSFLRSLSPYIQSE